MARVAEFDRPETPYLSWAAPHLMGSYSPYNLLARVWEWHVIGGGEEGEAE
jgi:ATP-dependent helicase/nuclease subunit B